MVWIVCACVPAGSLVWCLGGRCSSCAGIWWLRPGWTPWRWRRARCTLWRRWWRRTDRHPEGGREREKNNRSSHASNIFLCSQWRRQKGVERRRGRSTLTSSMTRNSWEGVSSTSINSMMLGCRTLRNTATSFSIRCSCSHTHTATLIMMKHRHHQVKSNTLLWKSKKLKNWS